MTVSHENLISVVGASRLTRRRFVVVGAAGSVAVFAGLSPAFAADKPKVGLVMKSLAEQAWAKADVKIKSSCMCQEGVTMANPTLSFRLQP